MKAARARQAPIDPQRLVSRLRHRAGSYVVGAVVPLALLGLSAVSLYAGKIDGVDLMLTAAASAYAGGAFALNRTASDLASGQLMRARGPSQRR